MIPLFFASSERFLKRKGMPGISNADTDTANTLGFQRITYVYVYKSQLVSVHAH